MGAREDNLESVVRGPSPSFNIQAFFEQMHNASATYVELWKRVIEAPADFAQRFPLYLALERTLSKAIDFEVTKELNQAVFTAIRDPNPIHHDQHNLVVGYGTTLGFAYSLLRANLPKEHLISMEANYTAKMMEGQTIRAKFIEYKERSDGTFVLAGQATGPKVRWQSTSIIFALIKDSKKSLCLCKENSPKCQRCIFPGTPKSSSKIASTSPTSVN